MVYKITKDAAGIYGFQITCIGTGRTASRVGFYSYNSALFAASQFRFEVIDLIER
jgi:hypothetical protein